MKLRSNMVLVVGGGISLVLLIIALAVLLKFRGTYERVNRELQDNTTRLNVLKQRDPFPSAENVAVVQTNREQQDRFFAEVYERLRKDQIEPRQMESAEFPLLLEKASQKLIKRAEESNVDLPPRFAFGFDRYAMGALPQAGDIPRLVVQLKMIEELCSMFYKSKVSDISILSREVFEQGGGAEPSGGAESGRGGRRRAAQQSAADQDQKSGAVSQDESGLFVRERFTIDFQCKDNVIWAVLNEMAESKLFIVVAEVELDNVVQDPKKLASVKTAQSAGSLGTATAGSVAGVAGKAALPVSRDERIVAGRELVNVRMTVDVFRFPIAPSEEGAGP